MRGLYNKYRTGYTVVIQKDIEFRFQECEPRSNNAIHLFAMGDYSFIGRPTRIDEGSCW